MSYYQLGLSQTILRNLPNAQMDKTTVGIKKPRITMMMFKSLKGMASEYSTQMFSIYENKTKTTT